MKCCIVFRAPINANAEAHEGRYSERCLIERLDERGGSRPAAGPSAENSGELALFRRDTTGALNGSPT
jgi:hypothetical protein